jgi:acyl-CoA thioester hydrolase
LKLILIVMFISETKIRVRYAETDQMDVVYHGNYAAYFEEARAESIRQLEFTYKDMEAIGVVMPVVELHITFLRPAHYDDLLTIKTILKEMPRNHKIEFQQEVYNEKGKLLTVGKITLCFVNIQQMEKTTMPRQLQEKLAPYFQETPGLTREK